MSRILYIGETEGFIGGIERYMSQTAQLLGKNGHQVIFAGNGQQGRLADQFRASFFRTDVHSHLSRLTAEADIIILHKIIPTDLLRQLPEEKTLFFAHDHQAYCRRHHYYTPLMRMNCHRAYSPFRCFCCSLGRGTPPPLQLLRKFKVLVLSEFMKNNLILNSFSPDRIIRISPFILPPSDKDNHVFLPDGQLRILFLGQLIRGKGCDLMLRTLKNLRIPFHATIAGDGKDRTMLQHLTDLYHLREKVSFIGWNPNPEQLFSRHDLLFFPSRWQEPFGLVGLEALANGIPVLAFQTGGINEWLLPNETGLSVPERNCQAAAQALTSCAQQPDLLKKWGENGRRLAEQSFSPQQFLNHFENLLKESCR